jgi:hypothetical protein
LSPQVNPLADLDFWPCVRNKADESLSKIVGGMAQLYKKRRGRARMDSEKIV